MKRLFNEVPGATLVGVMVVAWGGLLAAAPLVALAQLL